MASLVQYGRRSGLREKASTEAAVQIIQPPDLRQVTVLRRADWLRIQGELKGVNEEEELMREVAEQRKALHLKSKEVVKLWPNTIAGQRQKKLEAKRMREETEEEKRKQMDMEEAQYREQKRKEAIEKAETQLYHQTDRVKGLDRALQLTEVLKEREAQTELKERLKGAIGNKEKEFMEMVKSREDEALRKEQEKTVKKRLQRQATAEELKNQMKEKESAKQQQKLQSRKEGEEIHRLQELHQREQRMESEQRAKQKRDLMQAHMEQITNRDRMRATDSQKQEAEEKQRKHFLSAKQKMMALRKERKKQLFQEAQLRREGILSKLTATQQEQTASEEQRAARAAAEGDAKQAQLQLEEWEKKAAMLKAITEHRELMKREKEQRDKLREQEARDALQAKREADRIYAEKQQQKARKIREDERKLQDYNAAHLAEKGARLQRLREEEREFEAQSAELSAEEEATFQRYSQQLIRQAAEAKRNLFPLHKAASQGIGGGHGPVFGRFRPSYLVQDRSGAQMPKYVSGATEDIKKLHEAADIQDAKRRLGFTW
ncbi:cilia- and flagella- associated protein 210 [Menidia menidia]